MGVKRLSTPAEFWTWFRTHEERLHKLMGSALTEALYEELIKYDSRLGVEVCTDEAVRDVIVTAQDCHEAFGSVKELVQAAPRLDRWTFVALRPAKGFDFKAEEDGATL